MLNKIFMFFICFAISVSSLYATENDTIASKKLDEVEVVSFYRNTPMVGGTLTNNEMSNKNYGQEPSWVFSKMPSIFAFSDNGTEFGYGYFRIRGLDQTRINVTLDGMPWNESEDFGCYFANSPDIMGDMNSISVNRGSSSYNLGSSSYGGSINLQSVDLLKDTLSYAELGGGSYSYKSSFVYNSGLKGKWAFHVRGSMLQSDGYKEHSSNLSKSLGLKLGYYFNDKSSLSLLSITGYHKNGQGYIGSTIEEIKNNRKDNGCSEYEDDNFFQTVNKIQFNSWVSDKILFTSSLYYNCLLGEYRFDLDNYLIKMCETESNTGMIYNYGLNQHMYGGNAIGRYYFNNGSFTLGTNIYKFQREHFLDDRNVDKAKNISPSDYYANIGHKMHYELFANIKKKYNKVTLQANVQFRHINFWYNDKMNKMVSFDEDTKWNFLNFGAEVKYEFDSKNGIYLTYARTHREPTRSDMFGGNEWYCGEITTTDPEIANDIEIGYNVQGKKIKLNFNLFAMLFEDERSLTGELGMNGLPLHEKADESHRIGAELFCDWNVWNKFYYVNNTSLSNNKVKTDTNGKKSHVLTPNFITNHAIEYRDKMFNVGVEWKYRSDMYIDMANQYKVPYSWQFNLYGSVDINRFTISGHVNNITNRDNMQTGVLTSTNKPRYMVESPTNFYVKLRYNF